MFLHYLLSRNENELIFKVFSVQKENPIKNDWCSQVMKDLKEFGLDYLDFGDIQKMKKEHFKKLVKEKIKDVTLKYLLEGNHEKIKLKNLKYYQLELQPYLKCQEISTRRKKILFKFRSKMINVGHNFGNRVCCPLCKTEDDTQEHMMKCLVIKLKSQEVFHMTEKFEDVFGSDFKILIRLSKIFESAHRIREELNS